VAADCVTLWIGDSLGLVERACLRSVLRQGHSLAIYCYDKVEGIPDGVEVRDAADVLPKAAILRHKSGSVALFSDWFRYELQRRSLGTWLDTDNYLVAPLDMSSAYLFGKEIIDAPRPWRRRQRQAINGGVLRLPPDSPMLPPLLGQFDGRTSPDWLPWYWRMWAKVLAAIQGRTDLTRLPWGTAGTFALNAVAGRFGLSSQALPCEVFNPAGWYEADWIVDPRVKLEDKTTGRTVGVHLWNECIKAFKNDPAPAGSFLKRLHEEGA
jgi:hypothetical protein